MSDWRTKEPEVRQRQQRGNVRVVHHIPPTKAVDLVREQIVLNLEVGQPRFTVELMEQLTPCAQTASSILLLRLFARSATSSCTPALVRMSCRCFNSTESIALAGTRKAARRQSNPVHQLASQRVRTKGTEIV